MTKIMDDCGNVPNGKVICLVGLFSSAGLAIAILLERSGHRVFGSVVPGGTSPSASHFEQVEIDSADVSSIRAGISEVFAKAKRIDALIYVGAI